VHRCCSVLGCNIRFSCDPAQDNFNARETFGSLLDVYTNVAMCPDHKSMVGNDMMSPGCLRQGARKICAFWEQHNRLVCIRTYKRPHFLIDRTARFLGRRGVPFLTFMAMDDPTCAAHLKFYSQRPQLCIFGPSGGLNILNFMRDCALGAGLPRSCPMLILDDNIRALGTFSGKRFRPFTKIQMLAFLSAGERILQGGHTNAWSIRPHANSLLGTKFGKKVFPDIIWHASRRLKEVFATSAVPSLLYTAVLGISIDIPAHLCPMFGAGQDDVERTVRFIMHDENFAIFKNAYVCKPHFEKGGLTDVMQGVVLRLLDHERQRQEILVWAWEQAGRDAECRRWKQAKSFFLRFRDFRTSFRLFTAQASIHDNAGTPPR
jgi:hypothetical protein